MKKLYVICFLLMGCHHYHTVVIPAQNCTVKQATGGVVVSCPDGSSQFVPNGATGPQGNPGSDGSNGTNGNNGTNGTNGHSTLIVSVPAEQSLCPAGGYVFTSGTDLNDDSVLQVTEVTSTAVVCNGTNGTNGLNAPPTPFTPASLVEPCAANPNNPSAADLANPNLEVFLKLANGMLIASVSKNLSGEDTHFGVVTPGTWESTGINSNCVFTVDANGNITN
jgi:hypothetical protein